jgi:hypothetical protein
MSIATAKQHQIPPSPSYTGIGGASSDEQEVTYTLQLSIGSWTSYVPNGGSSDTDDELGTVYFKAYRHRTVPGQYELLDLTYSTVQQGGGASLSIHFDNDEEYLIDTDTLEKPLENHPDYETRWNYDLYQRNDLNGAVPTTPGWHSSATDTAITNSDPAYVYQWAKSNLGDNWTCIQTRTKPGVEAYLVPSPVVTYRFWHSDKSTAEAALETVGTKTDPGEKFGYTTEEWLVTRAHVEPDGKHWRATVEYTAADEWDGDLYT